MKNNMFILLLVIIITLSACTTTPGQISPSATPTIKVTEQAGPPASIYNEAPMLDEMVTQGELPIVDDRLPQEPLIIEPAEGVGEYGGTWHTVTGDDKGEFVMLGIYDPPLRWKEDYTGYEPGLATYEWSQDGKTFTFHFKEGVKWSDGTIFTTEDIQFWWDELVLNDQMDEYVVPEYMVKSDGITPIDMEFPDPYTWVWKSDQPLWVAPYHLAQDPREWASILKPKHFLIAHHPIYNPDATPQLFEHIDRYWGTPGYPCLFAWCLQDYTEGESWLWARNPYYWKVDSMGNQLPYIDFLQVFYVKDSQVRIQNIADGQYDAVFLDAEDIREVPFLLRQSNQNGYLLHEGLTNASGTWPGWIINQNYNGPEPEAQEIYELLRNQWFRKGLSLTLDRKRFVEIIWLNYSTPQQATLSAQSWHFSTETGEGPVILQQWQAAQAELDVAQADDYFTLAKFVDQDNDGWRELPSGASFELVIDLDNPQASRVPEFSNELVEEYWEAAGIQVKINSNLPPSVWFKRQSEGLYMVRNIQISQLDAWVSPDWIFPIRDNNAWPLEGLYYETAGKRGWVPEFGSPAARLQNLYDQGHLLPDIQDRHRVLWEAIRIHIDDGPFVIGVAGQQILPVVVKSNFHNIPLSGVVGDLNAEIPGNLYPEQFWMASSQD